MGGQHRSVSFRDVTDLQFCSQERRSVRFVSQPSEKRVPWPCLQCSMYPQEIPAGKGAAAEQRGCALLIPGGMNLADVGHATAGAGLLQLCLNCW